MAHRNRPDLSFCLSLSLFRDRTLVNRTIRFRVCWRRIRRVEIAWLAVCLHSGGGDRAIFADSRTRVSIASSRCYSLKTFSSINDPRRFDHWAYPIIKWYILIWYLMIFEFPYVFFISRNCIIRISFNLFILNKKGREKRRKKRKIELDILLLGYLG